MKNKEQLEKKISYCITILQKIEKLNNKSFDIMLKNGTDYSKPGKRNTKIDRHIADLLVVLHDGVYD